jgi:SAM-dependent methyltransferase
MLALAGFNGINLLYGGSLKVLFNVLYGPTMSDSLYSREFYEDIADSSYQTARIVLPIVFDVLKPGSVVDVGCGSGTWLAAAQELGATQLMGIDGHWSRSANPFRPGLNIQILDLERPIEIMCHFDLALCLEVAEHLAPSRAETLVADLCRLSEATLFSAAIPQQAGTHHVNCRWQSYWCELFSSHGRIPVDIVRPKVWGRPDVAWWYQQNTLLYLNRERASELGLMPPAMLDIAHPAMIPPLDPGLRTILKHVPRALARAVKGQFVKRA